MAKKAADKFIEALTNLLEGYHELQQMVADDIGTSPDVAEEEEHQLDMEIHAALSTEVRSAVETVLENDRIDIEDFAMVISNLTEAIEELDPDVFAAGEEDDEDEEEDEDDLDLDDDDLDFDEEELEEEKED